MFRANGDQEISKEGNPVVKRRYCPGCGILLQTEDPKAPGFLPIPKESGGSICQRCYRILNYGRFTTTGVSAHKSFEVIKTATAKADLTLLVADFFDPEGSFATRWDHLIANDLTLVVNKADLIPPKACRVEVSDWFREEWQRRFPYKPLVGLETISSREELRKTALKTFLTGKRVALVGMANVGKTSLLVNLLGQRNQGRRGEPGPVISHYPGTTQGLLRWALKEERIEVLDTPGLIPGTRVGDLLCPTCAARLLPDQRLQIKLWRLSPGEAVLFGDLAGIWNRSSNERMLVFFSSDRIKLHRTNGRKAEELLQASPDWLRATCANDPKNSIHLKEELTLRPGEDLYISGLGWVSAKKAPADLCLVVQKKAEIGIRPSLVGSRSVNTCNT